MKTKPNDPANPITPDIIGSSRVNIQGLTKREQFAMAAMQGFISSMDKKPKSIDEILEIPGNTASWSVSFADALINALNK